MIEPEAPPATARRPAFYRQLPPLTSVLLLVNVAWFVVLEGAGGSTDATVLALFGAKVGGLIDAGEWWRVVSSAFLHIGAAHLFINGWALWMLGAFVERAYGVRATLAIYAGAAVSGGLLSYSQSPHISAGASGAVMGLMGVSLLYAYRNRYRLAPRAQRTFWLWLLPFFVLSLALSFALPLIDAWAHLGGLVGGVLVALAFGNPTNVAPSRRRSLASWVAAASSIVLLGVPIGFAAHKAAEGVLWSLEGARTVKDAAIGLSFDLPRGWIELGRRDADSRAFYDGIGAALRVDVLPAAPKGREEARRDDDLQASLGGDEPKVAGERTIEERTVGPHRVAYLVVDSKDEPPIRQVRYAFVRPWGAVRLVLESRRSSAARYERLAKRIVERVRFDDTAPLSSAWLALLEGRPAEVVQTIDGALAKPDGALGTTSNRRPHALIALARAHARLGDRPKALELVSKAGKLAGRDASVVEARLELLVAGGDLASARRALREQQLAAAGDAELLYRLSDLAIRFKLEAEAVALLEDLTTTRRESATAFNNLAWMLATAKDPKVRDPVKAERAARLAVEKTAWREPGFIDTLAESLWAAGRRDEAVSTIDRAIALRPKSDYLKRQREKFLGGSTSPPQPTGAEVMPKP